jgi:hypothetical protein
LLAIKLDQIMHSDPFSNSENLASWTAKHLSKCGIDEVADWRMLEYWFQVEIFRLTQQGLAGSWRHVGHYEQPYHTEQPRSGSKTKIKWIDLVLAKPEPENPDAVVWVELKDIGRSKTTTANNAKGLGHDLAALWALNPTKTKELWLNPQQHSMDRGRLNEWNKFGPNIDHGKQLIGQIVIGPKSVEGGMGPEEIIEIWLRSFFQRAAGTAPAQVPEIKYKDTGKFNVYGLVASLPK